MTYGKLAELLGDTNKIRAVGSANGKNPIPIIIPCHRVIGANNNLVGYSGGIEQKQFLLKHEGASPR
ncbi:MAG: MGMT family protein [Fodinibius sp.]|nr:MGMT family protein [Fodinibius sp.]